MCEHLWSLCVCPKLPIAYFRCELCGVTVTGDREVRELMAQDGCWHDKWQEILACLKPETHPCVDPETGNGLEKGTEG